MAILREQTDLDKKPTWYLFLGANITVLIGCCVTFALFYQESVADTIQNFIACIVCNILAIIMCAIFIWLEAKGIMNKAMHFQRKWLYWYLAALIVFVVSIIFNFVFIIIFRINFFDKYSSLFDKRSPLIAYLVVTGVLTLISIGLQRYARFKIDLDIYKRTHGENPKKEEIEKDKIKADKKMADSKQQPTSGLSDEISKQ